MYSNHAALVLIGILFSAGLYEAFYAYYTVLEADAGAVPDIAYKAAEAFALLGSSLLLSIRHKSRSTDRLRDEKAYWQNLIEAVDHYVLVCEGLQIVSFNRRFAAMADITDRQESLLLNRFLADPSLAHKLLSEEDIRFETNLSAPGGALVPVAVKSRMLGYGTTRKRIIEIEDIGERKRMEERLFFLLNYDTATHLPNKDYLYGRIRSAVKAGPGKACAFIRISMEGLRDLHEKRGRILGDKLIGAVADKLKVEVPTNAFAAALEVGEFAVFCEDLPDALEARLVGQQLRRSLNRPIEIDGHHHDLDVSIGLAVYPEDAGTFEELLEHSALALTHARRDGKGRCQYFTKSLALELGRRNFLLQDFPRALENGEIQAWYQPILHAQTRKVAAFEALVRWKHPDFGIIPPFDFLAIAEEKDLMMPLTELMLRSGLEAAEHWPKDVRVSVNVSPVQLNSQLVDCIARLLTEKSFDPARLEVEVTEDIVIKDFAHAASMFSRLRALGVQVAMDDFGAGFTSLGNLRYLHFDRIKIDRIFTMNLPDHRRVAAVVRAMFVLARELDISVTVEGVETPEQFAFLQKEGCAEVQGFLFSQPKPLDFWMDAKCLNFAEAEFPQARNYPRLAVG